MLRLIHFPQCETNSKLDFRLKTDMFISKKQTHLRSDTHLQLLLYLDFRSFLKILVEIASIFHHYCICSSCIWGSVTFACVHFSQTKCIVKLMLKYLKCSVTMYTLFFKPTSCILMLFYKTISALFKIDL